MSKKVPVPSAAVASVEGPGHQIGDHRSRLEQFWRACLGAWFDLSRERDRILVNLTGLALGASLAALLNVQLSDELGLATLGFAACCSAVALATTVSGVWQDAKIMEAQLESAAAELDGRAVTSLLSERETKRRRWERVSWLFFGLALLSLCGGAIVVAEHRLVERRLTVQSKTNADSGTQNKMMDGTGTEQRGLGNVGAVRPAAPPPSPTPDPTGGGAAKK